MALMPTMAFAALNQTTPNPPPRHSVRKVHGETSASETFIAVQLNPQASVSPPKTHRSRRGRCSCEGWLMPSEVLLCDTSMIYSYLWQVLDADGFDAYNGICCTASKQHEPPNQEHPRR